jgi:hypothetical protein
MKAEHSRDALIHRCIYIRPDHRLYLYMYLHIGVLNTNL